MSMLRKYQPDPDRVVSYEDISTQEDATYVEQAVQIIDRMEHVLRNKTISLVKVL